MKRYLFLILASLVLAIGPANAQDYTTFQELETRLQQAAADHPEIVTLESIGKSRGGRDIWVLTISSGEKEQPALFIGANIEGYRLSATEAALATLKHLLANLDSEAGGEVMERTTFYIAPALNPDVMEAFSSSPTRAVQNNLHPVNDDADDETDEDGPEDLNGDGYITAMRYKHPEGTMIVDPDDPRIMREADAMEGERGEYRVITEGTDQDGDGAYNEDGTGGVILNMNFPHDFQYFKDGAGPFAASEPETVALLDFFLAHRNIAAVYAFGEESNLLNLTRGKGTAKAGSDMVKIPARFARFLGLEEGAEMHIDELVEIIKASPIGSQMEITRERVLQFLGTGPAMSIQNADYQYYEKVAEWFEGMRTEAELPEYADKPKPVMGDGSFVTWAYYHYGVPSFSSSVWEMPSLKDKNNEKAEETLTVEQLKEMSSEEFLALGEEKIDAFLKSQGAEGRMTAEGLMQMVESGRVTPKQMAQFIANRPGGGEEKKAEGDESKKLDWMAENLENGGFVEWNTFEHPQLGTVEIGGMIPMALENPPYAMLEGSLAVNARFALKLAGSLARIELIDVRAEKLGDGVYEITAYVQNNGFFPTASAMGALNNQAWPVRVKLEGETAIISGSPVRNFSSIGGYSRSEQVRWVINADSGDEITISASGIKCGSDSQTLTLR